MPKERIDHALHALNATMRRFIDNYSHKRENDQLTGANTWVILFIAEHSGSPVYRDVERHFGIAVHSLEGRRPARAQGLCGAPHRRDRLAPAPPDALTPKAEELLQTINQRPRNARGRVDARLYGQ